MNKDLIEWLIQNGAKYSVRYIDWREGHFTPPILLNEKRAKDLFDYSIDEIRFTF
jgi:hypothetical protein